MENTHKSSSLEQQEAGNQIFLMVEEILGVKVRKLRMPIRPGRNIAVLIEAAAANYRYSLMSDISPVDVIEQRIDAQAKGMDL